MNSVNFGKVYQVEDKYSRNILQQNLSEQGIESRAYTPTESKGYAVFTNEGDSADLDRLNTMLDAKQDVEQRVKDSRTVFPTQDFTNALLDLFTLNRRK